LVCCGRGAAATFEAQVLDSMAKLRVDYLDLFAFHGVNTPKKLGWVTRAGGCLDVARRLQAAGKAAAPLARPWSPERIGRLLV